jgi:protein subunit release factor A
MYGRFARLNGWEPTVLASSESDSGGFKDVILEVNGSGAYDTLRWESGVHRVQRVPATEASGRLHTSTVAAVVSNLHLLYESMTHVCRCYLSPKNQCPTEQMMF